MTASAPKVWMLARIIVIKFWFYILYKNKF